MTFFGVFGEGLEGFVDVAAERYLFFGGPFWLWGFLEGRVGGEAWVVDLLCGEKFLDAEDLEAWVFIGQSR